MNPGEVVDDRFEIERRMASGGMGHIYRARDRQTGQRVAFKLLHGHATERPVRFQREVEALLALQHPSIVRYVANGSTAKGIPWLAMEWLEGTTLGERIAKGPLGIEESLELGRGLATALSVVHEEGLVHRDLKPSNIFLVGGKTTEVKLIDFGLVRQGWGALSELTAPGMVLGTVGYLAPEQARGEPLIDARADVFAFGCVLFRCVTGKRPFVGEDDLSVLLKIIVEEPPRLRDLRVGVPAGLDDLVARMLAKAPAARPADGAAVAAAIAALSTLAAGGPATARSRKAEIGSRERRVMGLVLARDLPIGRKAPSSGDAAQPSEAESRLHHTVERHRGQLELLADGSSLVVFTSDGEATDLAARAARCALSVRALWPGVPVVVVSGRAEPFAPGETSGPTPRAPQRHLVGELIDRAVALLPGASGGSIPPPGASAMVRVDEVSEGLLGPGFILSPGGWLSGERESIDTPRTLLGKPSPCVGREPEIAALEDAYARSVEEPGANAVLVTAPAGIGKSRLASELLRRLRARDDAPEIWIGRGDPMSAGSAFGLLGQALRRALGFTEGLSIEARRRLLRERVARGERRPAEAARVAAFLGELLGTPFPDDVQLRAARRDPMLLGDQMRRAWEDFLRAECAARPLVLVLEDLHWGDLPTLKFVDAALRHLETRPFLVLGLGRPEVHEVFPDLWSGRGVEEVHLGRLPKRAGESLVRSALGPDVSSEAVTGLVERADGNALFLEELIRAVADGQGAALPETVLAIVQARLEALHVEERRVLRAASVFGQTFREEGVSALLGGLRAHGWLQNLTEQEVVVAAGDAGFRFRHALVREASYGMLTDADRALGHRLAGEWLEASGERDAMVLAEHFERGNEYPRAACWYQRAAEHAFEGNDLEAALARTRRGLVCVEDPNSLLAAELMLIRTKASRWQGLLQDAEDSALWAMRLFPAGGSRWCEAVAEAVHAAGKLGHTGQLIACTEALLAFGDAEVTTDRRIESAGSAPHTKVTKPMAQAVQDGGSGATFADREAAASYAIALARAATNLQLSAGRQALVEVLLERADAAAQRATGDPEVVGQVQWARSLRVLAAGDVSTFLALVQASQASLELAGDLRNACIQALNAGHGFLQLGLYEEAARIFRETADRADRLGLGNARSYARLNLGPALAGLGRLAEARATEEDALALFRAQSDRPLEASARTYLAMILSLDGDRAAAAREALAVAGDRGATPAFRALAGTILADLHLAGGRAAEALAAAEDAMSLLTSLDGIEEGESFIRIVYAESLHAAGDPERALAALGEARDRLLARARKVLDPHHRKSFLERVPENARTMARAAERLGG
jgi:tetratricopeptide (TPR) repeat protein